MRSVLVADDDANIRLLLRATLREVCHVLEAEDGDEAWELLRAHRCPVAVLDVQMPGLTGLEVARRIKADPRLAGTYVILLSARSPGDVAAAGMAVGADLCVAKPFATAELQAAVERALSAAPPAVDEDAPRDCVGEPTLEQQRAAHQRGRV